MELIEDLFTLIDFVRNRKGHKLEYLIITTSRSSIIQVKKSIEFLIKFYLIFVAVSS